MDFPSIPGSVLGPDPPRLPLDMSCLRIFDTIMNAPKHILHLRVGHVSRWSVYASLFKQFAQSRPS